MTGGFREWCDKERSFSFWLACAFLLHVILLVVLVLLPMLEGRNRFKPRTITVTVVSLPDAGGSPSPDRSAIPISGSVTASDDLPLSVALSEASEQPEKPAVEEKTLAPVAEKSVRQQAATTEQAVQPKTAEQKKPRQEQVPEKTKPKPAEQQKTIPKEENIPAVSRSTERAQQPGLADTKTAPGQEAAKGREQLQAVLERMKQQVGTGKDATPTQGSGQKGALQDALVQLQKKVQEQGGAGGTAGKGTGSGSGTGAGHVKGIFGAGQGEYNGVIAGIIQENWQFSGQMLRSMEGLEVYVSIRIIADGTIAEIRYDKRSPSEYLNHSARKALEKSSPLPPLPKEYGSREIWVGFVFTPEGLER